VLEVEVVDLDSESGGGDGGSGVSGELPSRQEIERLCAVAVASAGVDSGHLAVEFVSAERIAELNAEYRDKQGPTNVLSFPIDGAEPVGGGASHGGGASPGAVKPVGHAPRELGDIVICPEHTTDLREAIIHGALHLVGMDHETDDGEMLALQAELLGEPRAR
jgi:probable rRNA maturation factor